MRASKDNPTEVLLALDRELDHEVGLVLYGRAALYLGFPDAPSEFGTTQDVDSIIRLSQLPILMEDDGFWEAQERANRILEPKGLILTKMMRGNDPQDMEDVAFLVRKSGVTPAEMEVAFQQVRMPDLHELRDAFEKALPRVREILNRNGMAGS